MSAPGTTTTAPRRAPRPAEGAWRTLVRGVSLSPQLRVGLPLTLTLALVATAGRAIVPIAIQRTIDDGLDPAAASASGVAPEGAAGWDVAAVIGVLGWAAIAVVVTALASAWMNARLARVVETALSTLRVQAFRHIHDLSMLHQASEQRGSLVARVTTDVDEISRFMQWGGLNLIIATGQLTIALVVMAVLSWQLTLIVVATSIPFALAAGWFQRRLTVAYLAVRGRIGALLGRVAETVVGAPVVRAYGIEDRTNRQLEAVIEDHRRSGVRAGRYASAFSGTGEVFVALATAGAVVGGVLLGAAGQTSPGTVTAFLFLIVLFIEPVLIATEVINEGQNAIAGWRRVLDVLDVAPDVADPASTDPDGAVTLPSGPIDVRFEGVSFRYPAPGETGRDASGPVVLDDVDATIAPRTKVAVVGETGSGKTTFAKLLTRLMDPTGGRVLIDEVPVDTVAFASLRSRVVMVPQEGALFGGTLADNVRHGRPEATDDDLRLAFLELGLADWLEELPRGLDTIVGERGSALSAGERQLVALARAYVANPDLLVLDEATSAVDPATEVRLQRALSGLTSGRTTVTIAHRLSTAEAADEVLVFDAGRLVQRGPHAQLVTDADGVYARLHRSWVAGTAGR